MKKYLIIIFTFTLLCGCTTKNMESPIDKTNDKIKTANIQISDITEIDDMHVFEMNLKDSTMMFTAIDNKTKFISYHKENVNIYITYIDDKDVLLGEFIESKSNYCSNVFTDETSNNCSKKQIEDLKNLKINFMNDLENIDTSINELIEWANWYLNQNV